MPAATRDLPAGRSPTPPVRQAPRDLLARRATPRDLLAGKEGAPSKPDSFFGEHIGGPAESLLNVGTGFIGAIPAIASGLGTAAGRGLGLTKSDPLEVEQSISQFLTYQPRTDTGRRIAEVINYPAAAIGWGIGKLGKGVESVTGSKMAGEVSILGLQAAPMLFGYVRGGLAGRKAAKGMTAPKVFAETQLPRGRALGPPRGTAPVTQATRRLSEVTDALKMPVTPMAAGGGKPGPMATPHNLMQASAKDFANAERAINYRSTTLFDTLKKNFKPDQLREMGRGLDDLSVAAQRGEGLNPILARFTEEQRDVLAQVNRLGQEQWQRAKAAGVVAGGEGLPYWMPRVVVDAVTGEEIRGGHLGQESGAPMPERLGTGLQTFTPSLLRRKYQERQETARAAQAKLGIGVQLQDDLRAWVRRMTDMDKIIAQRQLVNDVQRIGRAAGMELVSEDVQPGFVQIDHPAFTTRSPRMKDGRVVSDEEGHPIIDKKPLLIRKEFEGPLRAVLRKKSGPIYEWAMKLKAGAMSLIMYSPLIHGAVEWGRAFPAMPGKVFTGRVYHDGARLKTSPKAMGEAIDSGLVPIGKRAYKQDISDVPSTGEAGLLATGAGFVHPKAGAAVSWAGDVWHNTLLWDRIADLQLGLYDNFRSTLMGKGLDRSTAARVAAHFANRFAGTLPAEAMSANARKLANLALFSRTFTIGNLGVLKDALTGLPRDVQAQILRDSGEVARAAAVSVAKRKAAEAVMLDLGLKWFMNSTLQTSFDTLARDKSLSKIEEEYVTRSKEWLSRVNENPFNLVSPPGPQDWNEPGKEDRILADYDEFGRAVYARAPMGKLGEEYVGYLTRPLEMLKAKESPMVRPMYQTLANEKSPFTHERVYDQYAKGVGGAIGNIGRIVKNFLENQIPLANFESMKAIVFGEANRGDWLRAAGPLAGMTFSQGFPGGPVEGVGAEAKRERTAAQTDVRPEIRRLIAHGQGDKARALANSVGMSGKQLRNISDSVLHPQRYYRSMLAELRRHGTPEQARRALEVNR